MRALLSAFLLAFLLTGSAQDGSLAIGQWRTHLPYNSGTYVTQSPEEVFYSTGGAILIIDKAERSVRFLDKVRGLSGIGIALLQYHPALATLLVVYENSSIDLVPESGPVITLNQIPNFANFVGEKTIASLTVDSDSTVLIAANYGVSRLNVRKAEFAWTTFTGVAVNDVATWRGNMYIATDEGIYTTPTDNPIPEDFSSWTLLGQEEGFPAFYATRAIEAYQDQLYFNLDAQLYRYNGEELNALQTRPEGTSLAYLTGTGPELIMAYACDGGCQGQLFYLNSGGELRSLSRSCVGIPTSVVQDEQGRLWFGDLYRDFRMLPSLEADPCDYLSFNSPYSTENKEIAIYNDEVWLATGGIQANFTYRFLDHGIASLIDGTWTLYSRRNTPAFQGRDPGTTDDDLFDFITIAIHPGNGKVYAGSFFEGLLEFDGENFTLFNDENSSLGNAVGDSKRTRISGLAFDEDNNLWVSNHTAESPLSIFTNEGNWQNFKPSCNIGEIHQLDVDGSGFKWIVSNSSSAGVLVFDEGNPEDAADDRCRVFTQNNSLLPTNQTNCLAADLDGDIWVGTAEGIIIFECGTGAFDPACQGTARIFTEGGFNEPLLNTEDIRTIAVDGANRKWIGTRNGVFVLSPDGEEEVAHFTSDNSPLLNDNIIDIAINDRSGEVFIGTDDGIISYRSDAIGGGRVHNAEVQVFPNPVRPDYRGPIAIQGLARDANVKITDISGRLVFETTAKGGQAIWPGTDYEGRRVASGVYLVFSADNPRTAGFNQPSSAVARIVFIR